MHRVVIMRDGPVRARQVVPFTMTAPQGSPDPRDLWKYLTNYEEKTGGEVLAIPHNGNLSNGIMFPLDAQWNGKALDETYVTAARQVGAALRGDPDQGRRRDAPLPVAGRRVRRLRDLGYRQPRRQRGKDRRHAGRRICARGAEARSGDRDASSAPTPTSSASSAPPTATPRLRPPRRTISSASIPVTNPNPTGCRIRSWKTKTARSWAGRWLRRDSPPSGRPRIPARPSSMRCSARKSMARPARA